MKVKPFGGLYQGRQSYAFHCPGCAQYDEPGYHLHATHTFNSTTWTYNGDGDKPTVSPSILVTSGVNDGYRCHSFVREGRIEFLPDCSHALAGKTVELLEIEP